MRLTVRRFRPDALFDSFFGFLDIKLGSEIILLFGLINKVAGLYGLITIFVGGTFLQLSFYAYSFATLFAFLWALRIVKSESAKPTLLVSHLYTLDHAILSLAHYLFFQIYWYEIPHDGRRTANSQAQIDLINLAASRGEIPNPHGHGLGHGLGEDSQLDSQTELRVALAQEIWKDEKVYAGWALVFGWLLKIYFILILYSYAAHLRSSTYHALPLTSRAKATQIAHPTTSADIEAEDEDGFEHGASNGEAGKGNVFVGRSSSELEQPQSQSQQQQESRDRDQSLSSGSSNIDQSNGEDKKKSKKKIIEGQEEEEFSWD